ncbi:hypothetical protein CGK74_08460 [Thauera propionica]|jgi:2'-5' RNA ligase|uniref:2'-5' RNA ligase n=2 Tax=Thauera propionica TaxID=2019431 RepID=A0A235EZ22_9RHOO|nr:hypothetical protein CGK74_08460 [Thauera propionica]
MSAWIHVMPPHTDTTVRNVRRDFPEWHLGRPHYVLWALDVDVAPVRERMALAQYHLSGLLLDDYVREPHVTLSLCGFPSASPLHDDDFGVTLLKGQIDALRRLAPEPFTIEIGALDGFTSAPYLTVHDPEARIATLRTCLQPPAHPLARDNYTPHVTTGLYDGSWPLDAVRARLAEFNPGAPLRLQISRLSLFGYAAPVIGGRLTRIADYDFTTQTLNGHETGILPFPLP